MGALVGPLVAAGLRVVAFDAIGHGESAAGVMGAGQSTLSEFADSLIAVVNQAGPAHAIVAHSAGCVAAGLAVGDGLVTGRLVFIAPMADPVAYLADFCQVLGIGPRVRAGMTTRLERRIGRGLADFDLLRLGPRLGVPLLTVHDRDDKETRFSDSQAIAAAWPDAELFTTHGLGHRRILTDPTVIDRVTRFLTADRPAPST